MVRPPFHVSVCPSPALGLGWFGHRSVTPPAAPGCWALLESRLRRSVDLASGRTLSFYFLAGVFFLGRLLGLGLVGCDPAWVPTFFWGNSPSLVRGFRWAVPAVWLSRLLVFLESLLGFFPLASSVCCGLEVVQVNPWLSTLRSLAVEVVTLVLCQVLVGLPSWGYSASGFLGPVVFLVFPFVWGPLPQADAVGCGLRWSGRMPSLLTCRSCSFVLGSSSLDLVGVGGFHCVRSPLSSFGMWSPFRVNSVFCHD